MNTYNSIYDKSVDLHSYSARDMHMRMKKDRERLRSVQDKMLSERTKNVSDFEKNLMTNFEAEQFRRAHQDNSYIDDVESAFMMEI